MYFLKNELTFYLIGEKMKNILIVMVVLFITSVSNLNAKTIWIKNMTNNHSSMETFCNTIIEDLKLTRYKQNIKIVSDDSQIKEQKDDILIIFRGLGTTTNTGNILYFYYIICTDNSYGKWVYSCDGNTACTDDRIYERARIIRNELIEYLDKWF